MNPANRKTSKPSQFYCIHLWRMGLALGRHLPHGLTTIIAKASAAIYWQCAPHRREIVVQNLSPILNYDPITTKRIARKLFTQFSLKIADLWRFEGGVEVNQSNNDWRGWETFISAHTRGKGVLLVTAHLGNWELGGSFFAKHNLKLIVLTQQEPDQQMTELRQTARARWGVETVVVGQDAFAFVEIIKRLQEGATIALLVDRPPSATAVKISLFGEPFNASIAAAELARASGCAILPTYIVRQSNGYLAQVLPEISYDRSAIGDRPARIKLTQEIMGALEPAIRQYAEQWYHFVPVWPRDTQL